MRVNHHYEALVDYSLESKLKQRIVRDIVGVVILGLTLILGAPIHLIAFYNSYKIGLDSTTAINIASFIVIATVVINILLFEFCDPLRRYKTNEKIFIWTQFFLKTYREKNIKSKYSFITRLKIFFTIQKVQRLLWKVRDSVRNSYIFSNDTLVELNRINGIDDIFKKFRAIDYYGELKIQLEDMLDSIAEVYVAQYSLKSIDDSEPNDIIIKKGFKNKIDQYTLKIEKSISDIVLIYTEESNSIASVKRKLPIITLAKKLDLKRIAIICLVCLLLISILSLDNEWGNKIVALMSVLTVAQRYYNKK